MLALQFCVPLLLVDPSDGKLAGNTGICGRMQCPCPCPRRRRRFLRALATNHFRVFTIFLDTVIAVRSSPPSPHRQELGKPCQSPILSDVFECFLLTCFPRRCNSLRWIHCFWHSIRSRSLFHISLHLFVRWCGLVVWEQEQGCFPIRWLASTQYFSTTPSLPVRYYLLFSETGCSVSQYWTAPPSSPPSL